MEISLVVFGAVHPQSVTMMNNYATLCLKAKQFDEAALYFEKAASKALYVPQFSDALPGFYCNLAEALFHAGQYDKSLAMAEKALTLSKTSKNQLIVKKTREFVQALQYDVNRKR